MSSRHFRRSMDVILRLWCCMGHIVRPIREDGLGESWMRMASASTSLQSLQLAAFVSLCWLRGCLKVRIGWLFLFLLAQLCDLVTT